MEQLQDLNLQSSINMSIAVPLWLNCGSLDDEADLWAFVSFEYDPPIAVLLVLLSTSLDTYNPALSSMSLFVHYISAYPYGIRTE